MQAALLLLSATLASSATLHELIQNDPRLAEFHSSLTSSNGVDLSSPGPFTVLAPINGFVSASAGLTEPKMTQLAADAAKLTTLLQFHVSQGQALKAAQLPSSLPTMAGQSLVVDRSHSEDVLITDAACGLAKVVERDIVADNGILHIIDSAFVPLGTFCPDTVFTTQGSKYERYVTAYGYDCRSSGSVNLASEKATKPVALATSDATKTVFWTDDMDYPHGSATSWASSVSYDGSTEHSHLVDKIVDPQGIATDELNQKLYFATHDGNSLVRTNYDGTNKETLVIKAQNESFQPSGVAVDAAAGLVFASIEQPNSTGYVAMFDLNAGFGERMLAGPKIDKPCKSWRGYICRLSFLFFLSFFLTGVFLLFSLSVKRWTVCGYNCTTRVLYCGWSRRTNSMCQLWIDSLQITRLVGHCGLRVQLRGGQFNGKSRRTHKHCVFQCR